MIDLSQNLLEGPVPRSLTNCTVLESLNLGNNQISDTFPFWLGALPGVLGQNDPFFKLNVENGHILKLLLKMASLMPRRRHIIKKKKFRHYSESRSWKTRLHFCTKAVVGKRGFIFALKPQLANAASFLY